MALRHNGITIDVIGQIGVSPAEWGSGDTSTKDNTLLRKPEIIVGDRNGQDSFDPVIEWNGLPQNNFDDLGTHEQGIPAGTITIQRSTYALAGQTIAVRVTGDPDEANNGLFYMYSDHLGSASVLQKSDGAVVNQARYYPFGEYYSTLGFASGPNDITDQGFTGHKHNDDLGLIYMNARFYVPGIGRFASADTIVPNPGNPQSFNRYSYVRNNPLKFVDPSGHFGICFQQGMADQGDDNLERNSELEQMCIELAENGYFGASGSFDIFGNDSKGIQAAVNFLREQMSKYPDEVIVVMGFSYGGGGALDFASLLDERGGDYLTIQDAWNGFWHGGGKVPENVMIDMLVLIDPVVMGRQGQSRYAKNHDSLPPNVKVAINLYATEDAYGPFIVFDRGLQNIEGALNIDMAGTDHCSIAASGCTPTVTSIFGRVNVPSQWSFPQRLSPTGPINTQTLNLIKLYLDPHN